MARWVLAASVLWAVLGSAVDAARADGPFEGTWSAGPTRIEVSVTSWGPDCGPQPQSTTAPAPGNVRVSQSGDHLSFHGRSVQRTDGCWSENRAVRKVSSSYQSGVWRTICRTPEHDPRSETGRYTVRATGDDRLELVDVSQYDWQLNESRCVGTITSRQVFTRVGGGAPTADPATPEERPERRACTPGAAALVRLRPTRTTVEPGEQARFRAQVVDAAGCPVRGRSITWELRRPEGRSGELRNGVFTAAATATEAEGEFTVVARAGGLEGTASVIVRTLDLSDLIAQRTSGGVVEAVDEGDATSESAAGLVAQEGGGEESSLLWPALGAATAVVLLLGVAVVLVGRRGRGRRGRPAEDDLDPALDAVPSLVRAPQASKPAPAGPAVCPLCQKSFEDPSVGFCPVDGAQLVNAAALAGGQALICPTCRRGFGEGVRFCPKDSDELVPYALFVQRHREREAGAGDRTKICPKCGDRYAVTVTFCGKDGAELVLVN